MASASASSWPAEAYPSQTQEGCEEEERVSHTDRLRYTPQASGFLQGECGPHRCPGSASYDSGYTCICSDLTDAGFPCTPAARLMYHPSAGRAPGRYSQMISASHRPDVPPHNGWAATEGIATSDLEGSPYLD